MVKWKWVLGASVVLALVAGGFAVIAHGEGQAPAASPAASVKTVAIEQTDLSDTRTFTGTLGFGSPQPLKGAGEGVITKLPKPGDTAERGESFYAVNGKPVPVFYGDTPLFRTLDNPELAGTDVAMVADNLAALGYKVGARPKDRAKTAYTAALSEAVKKWQKKAGLEETGTLGVGQIVVLPGKSRVNAVSAVLGDPVAGTLMTVTPTDKVITVPVEAGSIAAIKVGAKVSIVRPDSKEVPGKVTAVSGTVEDSKDQQQQGPPKITITVAPDDESAVADLDSASVQVLVTMESHPGVLAVPVGALLALREGGYAVQLPDGTLKPVKTGMFSRDKVEISGAGIAAGMLVVTAS